MNTIVGYIVLYACSLPFMLGVAVGSVEYYVKRDEISEEAIKPFFRRLSKPLSLMVYLFPFEEWERYIETASSQRGMINRIAFSIPIIFFCLFFFPQQLLKTIAANDRLGSSLNLIGIGVGLIGLFFAWRFGLALKSINAELQKKNLSDKAQLSGGER